MKLARNYIPALKYGAKIIPQDLAMPFGLQVGNIWYVDAKNGSDTANDGASWSHAFATLKQAHDSATDNNYDVIIVAPGGVGSGTGTSELAHWTFSKNLISVVGAPAPVPFSPRSRVLFTTAEDAITCLTISGSGNVFSDLQLGSFVDNDVLVNISGSRNAFYGVHFAGQGEATSAGEATACSLTITGSGGENYFNGCTVGIDTIAKTAANADLILTGATVRNIFEDSRFVSFCTGSGSGHFWVNASAHNSIDRFVEFKNCLFLNATKSSGVAMTVGMTLSTTLEGTVVLSGMTQQFGATDWADNFQSLVVGGPVPTAGTSNFLIGAA